MEHKVFADRLIPGAADYALSAIRAACSIMSPSLSEQMWRMLSGLGTPPHLPGKRIWYRMSLGTREFFICITPGEYRATKPIGEADVVLDPPEPDTEDTLVHRLSALLEFVRKFSFDRNGVKHLEMLYAAYLAGRPMEEGAQLFEQAHKQIEARTGDVAKTCKDLSIAGLYEHQMPLLEFSGAWALLTLQHMTDVWVQGDLRKIYESSSTAFQSYVTTVADSEHRAILVEKIGELGNQNYIDASASVKAGLNADSLLQLTNCLSRGASQYFIARLVAHVANQSGLKVTFKYKVVQAEEGYVCTQTGLLAPVRFLFEDPQKEPRTIAWELKRGSSEGDIQFRRCSAFWPCFTKRFTSVLISSAKALYGEGSPEEGLTALLNLQKEYGFVSGMFERGWVDLALLKIYKKLGDEAQVRRYATKIAAELVVMRELAGGNE